MSLPILPPTPDALSVTRRHFFGRSASGIGTAALATLLAEEAATAVPARPTTSLPAHDSGVMGATHFRPKAKRVIYLFMSGAPSQIDLLAPKPKMEAFYDKDLPESVRKGQRLPTLTSKQKRFPIAPSIYKFHKRGQAGTEISELLPHVGTIADEMALVRTIHTEAINHDPAITYIQTGAQQPGRPSMGAWLSYGLGRVNQNLPGFVVLHSTWSAKRDAQALYTRLWGAGFLPSRHQGVALRSSGDPVLYLLSLIHISEPTRPY